MEPPLTVDESESTKQPAKDASTSHDADEQSRVVGIDAGDALGAVRGVGVWNVVAESEQEAGEDEKCVRAAS